MVGGGNSTRQSCRSRAPTAGTHRRIDVMAARYDLVELHRDEIRAAIAHNQVLNHESWLVGAIG